MKCKRCEALLELIACYRMEKQPSNRLLDQLAEYKKERHNETIKLQGKG